jgi:magnesium transporter
MPETEWAGTYPVVLAVLFISALIPIWWFKRKKLL